MSDAFKTDTIPPSSPHGSTLLESTRSSKGFCSFSADLTTRTLLADYEQAFRVSRVWYRQMSSWSLTAIGAREAECARQSGAPP